MFTNNLEISFWEGVPEATRGNHLRREVKRGRPFDFSYSISGKCV